MANVILATYTCDPKQVDKTNYITRETDNNEIVVRTVPILNEVTNEDAYTFTLNETMDFLRDFNYCIIDGKEYFLEPIRALKGGICEVKATVDVLHQNRDKIYASEQLVERNAQYRNNFLQDNEMSFASYDLVDCYEFPHAINNDSIVLITVG